MNSQSLRRAASALLAVLALTSAAIGETRATARGLATYREAAVVRPRTAVLLPSSAFHEEHGLPLSAIDEDPAEALAAAGRYGWILLACEAMLDGGTGPVELGDGRAFDLARLDAALAVSGQAMAKDGHPVAAAKRYVASLRLAASLRARGTVVDLVLGASLIDRTLRAIARDRPLLDEVALRAIAGYSSPPTAAIFERIRLHHARSIVGWVDGPTDADPFYLRGPLRDELALDALRDFDAEMDVAAAAYERGEATCPGCGVEGSALAARFERLRATDAAWAAFHGSLSR